MRHSRSQLIGVLVLGLSGALLVAPAAGSEDRAARRLEISQMPPAEQQELLRKQEQFLALPAEEQARLRTLQAGIDADPKSDQLNRVLKQYHEWLKTLSPGERAELAELPPADRVAKVMQLQQRQRAARLQAQRIEALTSDDHRVILRWTEDLVWEHRERIMKDMPEPWRKRIEKEDSKRQRRTLLYAASFAGRKTGANQLSLVKPQDIDQLNTKLSASAQAELAKATSLAERRKIVAGWIGVSMHQLEPWRGPRKMPAVVEQELTQFFEHDLRPSQRERLLKLPHEQMREELRRMYFERERWEQAGGEIRPGPPDRLPGDRDLPGRPRGPRPPRDGDGRPDAGPREKKALPEKGASQEVPRDDG